MCSAPSQHEIVTDRDTGRFNERVHRDERGDFGKRIKGVYLACYLRNSSNSYEIKEDRGWSAWLGVNGYQRKSSRGGVNTWTSSASSIISMLCSMFAGMA